MTPSGSDSDRSQYSPESYKEIYRIVVGEDLCDELNHMAMKSYFSCITDAMFMVMESLGVPRREIAEQKRCFAVVSEDSTWYQEILEGEEIVFVTAVERIGDKTATFQHRIVRARDDAVSFANRFTVALMDLENRRAMTIPDDFRYVLENDYPAYAR